MSGCQNGDIFCLRLGWRLESGDIDHIVCFVSVVGDVCLAFVVCFVVGDVYLAFEQMVGEVEEFERGVGQREQEHVVED